jgi:hypothetical protein
LNGRFKKKLWKLILDNLILIYFSILLQTCDKNKKNDAESYAAKLKEDKDLLQEAFEESVFVDTLKKSI